jgi:ribonuclease/clavin/mitogillin
MSSTTHLTSHLKQGIRTLPPLPDIERLSPLVTRILGGNPGPYTLQGTNTYLVGNGNDRVLIDTGDGEPSSQYVNRLQLALRETKCLNISIIIATHWHHDHVGGIPDVLQLFPQAKVYKHLPAQGIEPPTSSGEGSILPQYQQFIHLPDNFMIKVQGASLRCMYAPGHTNDMTVLLLEEENSMFTSDNVLGIGTGVASDLVAYLDSLEKMQRVYSKILYPGHGPVLHETDSQSTIHDYILHRKERVTQVLHALGNGSQSFTPFDLVPLVYGNDLPSILVGPAAVNVDMALRYLISKQLVIQGDDHMFRSLVKDDKNIKL